MSKIALQEVKFLSNHIPQMHAGEYTLAVKQQVQSEGHRLNATPFAGQQKFAVGGHRFSLHSTEVYSVFPPQGNLGEHSNVLPHIVLKRSTLPWEWFGVKTTGPKDKQLELSETQEGIPWMGVLMLQEDRRWRGTFSIADFQQKVTTDKNVWKALVTEGKWFIATKQADIFSIQAVENRQPIKSLTLTDMQIELINQYLSLHIISGVEKAGGTFSKKDFQKSINNQNDLWKVLVAANWFYSTLDTDTFIAASPSSRHAWASLQATSLNLKEAQLDNLIQLAQDLSTKIDTYLDKHRGPKILKIADLTYPKGGNGKVFPSYLQFPSLERKIFEDPEEKVQVLDIEKGLLKRLLSSGTDLTLLTHVRQAMEKDGQGQITSVGDEKALLIGNRLPAPGATCNAFLVGFAERLSHSTSNLSALEDTTVKNTDLIRLVILKKWGFACLNPKKSFMGLLKSVNEYEVVNDNLGQPLDGNQQSFTLKLPAQSNNASANKYLAQGAIPLLHQLRDGRQIPGWYRGPLATGQHIQQIPLPKSPKQALIAQATELLHFDQNLKMFDTSYAAAWELGRMLLLAQKDIAIQLHHWKRKHKANLRKAEQVAVYESVPFQDKADMELAMPPDVVKWFEELRLLKHIPFNYLVPKEELLPVESLRFFQLDEQWMEALIDGAFSIGRVAYNDSVTYPNSFRPQEVSGILLRSEVVSGWKELQIDGFAELPPSSNLDDEVGLLDNQLNILRMDRLSDNILLVLFEGTLKTVDIHLPPEAIHFGFDAPTDGSQNYEKTLREEDGTEMEGAGHNFSATWKDKLFRVVDMEEVQQQINKKTNAKAVTNSAEFAFYMIEGVPKVRFVER